MDYEIRDRVLIVDDDSRLAEKIQRSLEKRCKYTRTASTFSEALRELCSDQFAVVVIDWVSPDNMGPRVLKFIQEFCRNISTIVYSAHETSDADSTALGADQFVLKSSNADYLRCAVDRAAALSRERIESKRQHGAVALPDSRYLPLWNRVQELRIRQEIQTHAGTSVLVEAADKFVRHEFSKWLFSQADNGSFLHEIDAEDLGSQHESILVRLFGECSITAKKSSFTPGLLETVQGGKLLIHNVHCLSVEVLEELSKGISCRRFRRLGSDRDLDLGTDIFFTADPIAESFESLESELRTLCSSVIRIPASPAAVCDPSTWLLSLFGQENLSGAGKFNGMELLCERLGSGISWKMLKSICESSDECHGNQFPADGITRIAFFESQFIQTADGSASPWKAIADLPRFLYVCWLLSKTCGNIAEAARISGMTRAAIYAALNCRDSATG